jgi:hypothetical protein
VALLTAMQRVADLRLEQVEKDLALGVINLAMTEMTKDSKEVIPDYQGAASNLLVTMGMKYTTEVINKLLELFGPGVVPHFFLIKVQLKRVYLNHVDSF